MNITFRHRVATVVAGFGLAFAAMIGFAAESDAQPIKESTIKSECKDAGGTYVTSVKGGKRFSACQYRDINGGVNVDYYVNGDYYGTRP